MGNYNANNVIFVISQILLKQSDEELVDIWNYIHRFNDDDEQLHKMSEFSDFEDIWNSYSRYDKMQMNFVCTDNWFIYDGEEFYSFADFSEFAKVSELAEYAYMNDDDFGINSIALILDELGDDE